MTYKPGTNSWKFFQEKVCPACDKRAQFSFETRPESNGNKEYRGFCIHCGTTFHFIRGETHYEIRKVEQLELNFTGESFNK